MSLIWPTNEFSLFHMSDSCMLWSESESSAHTVSVVHGFRKKGMDETTKRQRCYRSMPCSFVLCLFDISRPPPQAAWRDRVKFNITKHTHFIKCLVCDKGYRMKNNIIIMQNYDGLNRFYWLIPVLTSVMYFIQKMCSVPLLLLLIIYWLKVQLQVIVISLYICALK